MGRKLQVSILTFTLMLATSLSNVWTPTTHAAVSVYVDPEIQYQTLDGWGTSLAWWGNVVGGWNDPLEDEIVDKLFNPTTGLGLNIVRYNIGGGENPTHHHMDARPGAAMPGFKATETSSYNWLADENQISVLRAAKAKGADTFEAFSNSAPYWMTINNCASGNFNGSNNLKTSYYGAFATYLTDVVQHFRTTENITFSSLSALNEPISTWWTGIQPSGTGGNNQEGMHFDLTNQQTMINTLYNEMNTRGELAYTKLSGPEEYDIDLTYNTLSQYNAATTSQLNRINTHTYEYRTHETDLRNWAAQNGKKIWVSEFGNGGVGDRQNIDASMNMSNAILKDLNGLKATAWNYWQAVEDSAGDNNYGLMKANFTGTKGYTVSKKYYAMGNYSKYIKKGYKIVSIDNAGSLAAYDAVSQKLVIVTTNDTTSSQDLTYDLSAFSSFGTAQAYRTSATESLAPVSVSISNKLLNHIAQPRSITTYVITNAVYAGEANVVAANDNDLDTAKYQFQYSSNWSYYAYQSGAYKNDNHYSNTTNAYVQFSFDGTGVKLYGAKDPGHGIAEVIIDEGTPSASSTLVDYYSPTRQDNVKLFERLNLASGTHTLKVKVTGTKNTLATSAYITVDKVEAVSNLLGNAGFESGGLSPWAGEWNPSLAGVESYYPKSGAYDAYLHPTSSLDVAIYQTVTVPATRTYTLTAYAATNIVSGVQLGADVNGTQAAAKYITGNTGYGYYTLTFNANAGQTVKIWYYANRTNGWAVLDQVVLK
ncbi:glycoside hydrolase [Cohnella soli]|uniref:Glycoside hydrolase n=1 Tax=Cohnella soli TaxID=425005 RepID=A0ABW0HYB5_9BACL